MGLLGAVNPPPLHILKPFFENTMGPVYSLAEDKPGKYTQEKWERNGRRIQANPATSS